MPNDPISQAMGIQPIQVESTTKLELDIKDTEFETSKDALHKAIGVGIQKLGELADIASATQDSRDYRVLKELIEAITSASGTLVDIKRTDVETKIKETQTEPTKVVNQNLILSTNDLAKLIEEKKNV